MILGLQCFTWAHIFDLIYYMYNLENEYILASNYIFFQMQNSLNLCVYASLHSGYLPTDYSTKIKMIFSFYLFYFYKKNVFEPG